MIQWSRVSELRNEIGEEDFEEVVELFLEEVDVVTTRLRVGSNTDDLEQDLHFLKGSALNLGFAAFSALCQDGERMAASGRASEVNLNEILDGYEASRAVFIAELPKQVAA